MCIRDSRRGGHQSIRLKRLGNEAWPWGDRAPTLFAVGIHRDAPCLEFEVGDGQVNATIRNVDFDGVTVLNQADSAAFGGFRRRVAD